MRPERIDEEATVSEAESAHSRDEGPTPVVDPESAPAQMLRLPAALPATRSAQLAQVLADRWARQPHSRRTRSGPAAAVRVAG